MNKPSQSFRKWIESRLVGHGAIKEFVKKTKFSRSAVEDYRDGVRSPKLTDLETLVERAGADVREVLGTPISLPPDVQVLEEELREAQAANRKLKARIREMESRQDRGKSHPDSAEVPRSEEERELLAAYRDSRPAIRKVLKEQLEREAEQQRAAKRGRA